MMSAQNSLNLNCKVRVMKEAPGPSVSEEIADIFRNYNIDSNLRNFIHFTLLKYISGFYFKENWKDIFKKNVFVLYMLFLYPNFGDHA